MREDYMELTAPVFNVQTYIYLLVTLSLGLYLAYIANYFGYGLMLPGSSCRSDELESSV